MKTYLGLIREVKTKEYGKLKITVTVAHPTGKLNQQMGYVMSFDELDEMVDDVLDQIDEKSVFELPRLEYLPHTLEILASRLWEEIDDKFEYQARVERLKIEDKEKFVVYDGRMHKSARRRRN